MTTWTEEEVAATLEKGARLAATDAEFRKLCLTDPAKAIQQISGKEIPAGLKIKFVDGSDADLTLVLPPMAAKEGELMDEDLESVAGGVAGKPGGFPGGFPGGPRPGGPGFPGGKPGGMGMGF